MPNPRIHLETCNIANAKGEFYWRGNPDGDVLLILGSCRVNPYLNYLTDLHTDYKIYCIHPYAYNQEQLEGLEHNDQLHQIFSDTKVFIKEYHANYGIFNTLDKHEKNIYQFGMSPDLDLTIPAWNDHFVYVNDIKEWCKELDPDKIHQIAKANYNKFYTNCAKTDFPEVIEWFFDNFTKKRLSWNFNHITKDYSVKVFELLNSKFLKLPITNDFLDNLNVDHLQDAKTELTNLDRDFFGYLW